MKQTVFITSFLTFSISLYGQIFAPIGAQWYYSASANGAAPTGSEYYHYQSAIDTLVGGHPCKKISITYYQFSGAITYPSPVFTYQSNDTVFYYNSAYSRYFPLYIFKAVQGDTLTYHSPSIPVNPTDTLFKVLVDSVTILKVGTVPLKRIWTTSLGNFSVGLSYSELIGSDWLMLPQPSVVIPEWDGPIRCYSDSNLAYYCTSRPCDYLLTNGISEIQDPFGLSIYPNPASNQINIQTTSTRKFNFNIYNALGQLIKSGSLENSEVSIDINNLTSGCYSIEVSAGNKTKRMSFIVK